MSSRLQTCTPKNSGKRTRVIAFADDGSDTEEFPSTASPPAAPKKIKKTTIESDPTASVATEHHTCEDEPDDREEPHPKQRLEAALRALSSRKNRVREDFLISFENLSSDDREILTDKGVDIGFMGTKAIDCDWKWIEFCMDMGIKVTLHSYPGAKVSN